jgi:hypothetical protein
MTLVVSALPVAQTRDERADAVRADIRKELLQLPYYSVFDFLAFKYDRGTAVLMVMPTRRRSKRTQSTPSNACRVSTRYKTTSNSCRRRKWTIRFDGARTTRWTFEVKNERLVDRSNVRRS